MSARQADYSKFDELNVQIIGISSDSTFAAKTFADSLKLFYSLLSDRGLQVIRRYGVAHPDQTRALGSFFLIDERGILRQQWLLGDAGGAIVFPSEPILRAVREIKGKR